MINASTKSDIILNRFAYEPNEEVLVNANELCAELIAHETCKRQLALLMNKLEAMSIVLSLRDRPSYRRVNFVTFHLHSL
jgi:hypothetical protein